MEVENVDRTSHPTGPDLNKARQESQRVEHREAERRSDERETVERRAAAKADPNRGGNVDFYA